MDWWNVCMFYSGLRDASTNCGKCGRVSWNKTKNTKEIKEKWDKHSLRLTFATPVATEHFIPNEGVPSWIVGCHPHHFIGQSLVQQQMLLWFTEGSNLRCKWRLSRRWWSLLSLDDSDHESKFEVKRPAANSLYIIILRTSPKTIPLHYSLHVKYNCDDIFTLTMRTVTLWRHEVANTQHKTLYCQRSNIDPFAVKLRTKNIYYPRLQIQMTRVNLVCTFCRHHSQQYKHGYELTKYSGTMSN